MTEQKKEEHDRAVAPPEAKRRGRQGVDPKSEPEEFSSDTPPNRFTPPPEPKDAD